MGMRLLATKSLLYTQPVKLVHVPYVSIKIRTASHASTFNYDTILPILTNSIESKFEHKPINLDNNKLTRGEINQWILRTLGVSKLPADEIELPEVTDLRTPHLLFPLARKIKRKLVLHVGPTNSGKTHSALHELSKSKSGVYCAPLRLLAGEIYDRMNNQLNVNCNLITGQQQILVEGASHTACTIEMVDIHKHYDVALIDEYQLISDPSRGWAWTRALLGLPASVIHLTGDFSRIELIKNLAKIIGDELEVRKYERLSPLSVSKKPMTTSLGDIQRGDAIIVFSRKDIYKFKKYIEEEKKMKCCVVYGSLPPESRTRQAELFNDPNSDYQVLIGTDCIGLGLNLNIRRIIFSTIEKYDGYQNRELTPAEIRQIAGRAGRYCSQYPVGVVTTFDKHDLYDIREAVEVNIPSPEPKIAMLFPTFDQIHSFYITLKKKKANQYLYFSDALRYLLSSAAVTPLYEVADSSSMLSMAAKIDLLPLSLSDRYVFILSPCDVNNIDVFTNFYIFVKLFSQGRKVNFVKPNIYTNRASETTLAQLETIYKITELYIWLAYRFPDAFVDLEGAKEYLTFLNEKISYILSTMSKNSSRFAMLRRRINKSRVLRRR